MAKQKNIRIKDMLTDCSLSINTLSQVTDKKGLASMSLAKIADYLDCSVDYLLGRIDKPELHPTGEIEQAFYAATPAIQDAIKKLLDLEKG